MLKHIMAFVAVSIVGSESGWAPGLALTALRHPETSTTLCAPAETVVFSCQTGTKRASVCASADITDSQGHLQYRYGRPGAVELTLPGTNKGRDTIEGYASLYPNGVTTMHLRFRNGDVGYVVYAVNSYRTAPDGIREWEEQAGVVVEKGGAVALHLTCKESPDRLGTGELEELLFEKAMVVRDEKEFTPPEKK